MQHETRSFFALNVHVPEKSMAYLTLRLTRDHVPTLYLTIQDARDLANALIKRVHQAEVQSTLNQSFQTCSRNDNRQDFACASLAIPAGAKLPV